MIINNYWAGLEQVTVVMKIYWGDAREKILDAIDKTPLSFLVIGSRGLGKIQRYIFIYIVIHSMFSILI